ncbi:MAG: MarR family transcriptional regulator [Actinomycetales bacterium]|nr:MarR family transcriptional regulator [Actinomycetales bacterium]
MPRLTSPHTEDEVDRIVAAWRRERPDLDVAPLEVLSRITRLARHVDRDRSTVFARHGLEPWEFDTLTSLRLAGPPHQLSASQLISRATVPSGTMTDRIDRLVERELAQRLPDPTDGSGIVVRLTPSGRELVDVTLTELLERERRLLSFLDIVRCRELANLLRRLVAPFDGEE